MDTKKIVFFHEEFPFGGAERITMDIANYISSHNYKTYIIALKINRDKLIPELSTSLTFIELPDKSSYDSRKNTNFIIEQINSLHIDIFVLPVRTFQYFDLIKNSVNCKFIFANHGSPFWEKENKLIMARKRRDKSFLQKLEWYFISYPKYIWFNAHEKKIKTLYKTIYDKVSFYTVLCDEYKEEIVKKLNLDPTDNKIRVIPNSEHAVSSVNYNKKKQIIYVGRMSYEDKRVDRLLYIWNMIYEKVPDWELILIGDGKEKENLQELAKKLKLPRIIFVGHQNNVQKYYHDASVVCLTSTYEGWGLCLTEAQTNGVIPFAFNCSAGVAKIIEPSGTNGFLIPPFDLEIYAKNLLVLLKDPDLIKKMQKNVVVKSKEYSIEVVGKKWLALFNQLSA